jgi:hypothetical protein
MITLSIFDFIIIQFPENVHQAMAFCQGFQERLTEDMEESLPCRVFQVSVYSALEGVEDFKHVSSTSCESMK